MVVRRKGSLALDVSVKFNTEETQRGPELVRSGSGDRTVNRNHRSYGSTKRHRNHRPLVHFTDGL